MLLGLPAFVAADEPDDYEGGYGEEDGVDGDAYYAACWELCLWWSDECVAAAEDCVGYDGNISACWGRGGEIGLGGFGVAGCFSAEGGGIS